MDILRFAFTHLEKQWSLQTKNQKELVHDNYNYDPGKTTIINIQKNVWVLYKICHYKNRVVIVRKQFFH
jgi:hypothetical protein